MLPCCHAASPHPPTARSPPWPPISCQPGGSPQLVVGCLDINQGAVLPAEQLVGRLPPEGDRRRLRAYLSNVAVWEGARRRGVARRLIQEAMRHAAAAGVQHLYGEVAVRAWLARSDAAGRRQTGAATELPFCCWMDRCSCWQTL